ncbi:MAG: DegT/DnrJ/EryC1/StrS family aminotransferase [Flavobacteriales bacterium]|nr:DegT/DnrJ/EryC1/StrS family aminotransferase [Flavobacteriales bacterium]
MAFNKKILFFNGRESFIKRWSGLSKNIDEIFEHGKFSHGKTVQKFEHEIKMYTRADYAIALNSGTDALTLLLRACGIGPGDEVIVPCFTFVATAMSVVNVGAIPVFVDIDDNSYSMSSHLIEKAITSKTKAIMPVHLFVQMADMTSIMRIAKKHNLKVLEDSAESIGMWHNGVHAGLLGDAGILSFFPTKTLGALGDAGMVITNDSKIAERVALMRHHGRMGKTVGNMPGISNEALYCGTNSKMDDIQAGVLLNKLNYLEEDVRRRDELAAYYNKKLKNISQVCIPKIVNYAHQTSPVYYCYVIEAHNRNKLHTFLKRKLIETEIYYPIPIHMQPCFKHYGYFKGDFPVAERVSRRTLALPLYPDLKFSEIDRIAELIYDFYGENNE